MNRLKKNLVINVSYQLFVVIIPLILAPYVSRTIGAEGAGIYSYTYSIAYCFALVGMLGVANYGNRTIAAAGSDIHLRSKHFWNIWSIQVVVSILACVCYILYVFILGAEHRIISYIQIITVLCSVFDISWFFFGIEKFQITVLRNLFIKISNLVLVFVFVKNTHDLGIYTLIMTCGTLLNGLLLFPFLRREIVFVVPKWKDAKMHLKPIIILFFPVVAISIYKIMDKIMIGMLSTTVQTGYYEYAEKIIGLPGTVITAVGAVMLPRLSSLIGQKDTKQARFLIQVTMEVMMGLTFAMAWGIFAIATDFAPTFFGEEFETSGLIMMGLAPAVICQGWANVIRTQYLIPTEKDSIYVQSAWIGAIVNLAMNAILIPHLQAMGAAVGTVCAELAVAGYQTIKVRSELPIGKYVRYSVYYAIPSFVMVVVIKIISHYLQLTPVLHLIVEILIGGLVYLVLAGPYLNNRLKKYKVGKV